ncbi:hypothetical protein M408DRAFT_28640 [Serendipita vermifera MAFF 305830]|uniref:Transmembrane protein n=1 Tax=Serendipita vermifera MAFF 305830 TaxID=933852 RepID=A0A0C3AR29_SERVB|nr:hypothetical protein M408DRAFT_28640 [Serendipita vermifera MAFF 305830]
MSGTIVVDDADPGIQYTGSWTALTAALYLTNPEHMKTIHESHQQGDTITYTFTGTQITVYCSLSSPHRKGIPSSTYQIDSGTPVRFNSTGEVPNVVLWTSNVSHIPFYTSPSLPEGQHTIKITVEPGTGTPSFYFDFFAITTSNWQAGPNVIVDDADTSLIDYGPGWTQEGIWREFGGSVRRTLADTNGTGVFKFQGTSLSVYASLNGYYGGTPYIAAFALDDRPRIFHTEGLADNVEHRLTMTAIVVPGVPAWFFDYFVFTPSSASITSVIPDSGSSTTNAAVGVNTSTPPTGAIVGGVVGGIAVLALVLFALFWRRRRQQLEPRHRGEKKEIDGSPPKAFASQLTPTSDDSQEERELARPADELAYRTASLPMKGRFNFAREGNGVNRAGQRQTMLSSLAGDVPLSPSATSSSVPGMSQSAGTDDGGVSISPAAAIPPPQRQQRQNTNPHMNQGSTKDITPFSSFSEPPTTTATAPTIPMFSVPNVSRVPVREIDAGIRLDSGDSDDGNVPDTLPPLYSRFQLSEGQHTIKITIDTITAGGPSFYFDFFAVTTSNWQTGPTVIVDDTDRINIQYGPSWTQEGVWRDFGLSVRRTPGDTNGTAVLKFQGRPDLRRTDH